MVQNRVILTNFDNMLCRFNRILERDGQKTDGQNCNINIARQCADTRQNIPANFPCSALDLQLTGDHLCAIGQPTRPTEPFILSVRGGGAIW